MATAGNIPEGVAGDIPEGVAWDIPEGDKQIIVNWIKKAQSDEKFCFIVAGEAGAGKSALINSIANQELADTGSGADSVTKVVEVYDQEIDVSGVKLQVRAVDTPGLNDTDKTSLDVFREVVEKAPKPHAIVYSMKITDRFRRSDQQLLSAMSKCYGKEIWKRVVFVLTHADTTDSPNRNMEGYKKKIVSFLSVEIGIDKSIVDTIPFCFAAKDCPEKPFFPCDAVPVPEGEIPKYNWKITLIAAALSIVPAGIAPILLKLHEPEIKSWFEKHGYKVVGVVAGGCFVTALAFGIAAIVVPITAPIALPVAATAATAATVQATVGGVGAATTVGFTMSGAYLTNSLRKKYQEYLKEEREKQNVPQVGLLTN